jgi:hypothetical protein
MEPYDPGCNPGKLGGVGEGLCPSDEAKPLTQLRVSSKLLTRCNPLQITAKHLL